jgi:hypothetical protein
MVRLRWGHSWIGSHERTNKQFDQIGQRDHFVGEKWFKQMAGWPDQWEIRRGDHRLMGFRMGNDLILCLHRVKHRDMANPADLACIDRFAREWQAQYGAEMDH